MAPQRQSKYMSILLLTILPITIAKTAKTNARPVHEIINEQSRIDDKIRISNNANLPYGNPLAGNSQQNARLHAQNQQAMYNAEKIRQHRAQLLRWTKAPPKMDSYMKAYQESQENHHLALEQQQSKTRDPKPTTPPPKERAAPTRHNKRGSGRTLLDAEPIKITKADAIVGPESSRNHRSYGSTAYLYPNKYQSVNIAPGTTYDQGVTIKPHSNTGLAHLKTTHENSPLYTEAIASHNKHIFDTKHYDDLPTFQPVQHIDTLSSLLKKPPIDQVSGLNALVDPLKTSKDPYSELKTPVDLYFFLKDTPVQSLSEKYEKTKYAHLPLTYASAFVPEPAAIKDHTPITEEVNDIPDPNAGKPLKLTSPQPTPTLQYDTTTKSNNYYKVEVTSQTITSGITPDKHVYLKINEESESSPQALHYEYQPTQYGLEKDKTEGDLSESYLHHNAVHKGVQHLTEDGTGVSAYGENSLQYAANYEFGYRVQDYHSGNHFGHQELKEGSSTKGHYHVLLPDGRMQNVQYSAGPGGYHADISYDHLEYEFKH